jgi:hypothetical protein
MFLNASENLIEFLSRKLAEAAYPARKFSLVTPATELRSDSHRGKLRRSSGNPTPISNTITDSLCLVLDKFELVRSLSAVPATNLSNSF